MLRPCLTSLVVTSSTTLSPSSTSMVAGVQPHMRASTANVFTAPVGSAAGALFEYRTAAGTRISSRLLINRMSLRTAHASFWNVGPSAVRLAVEQRVCHAATPPVFGVVDHATSSAPCGVIARVMFSDAPENSALSAATTIARRGSRRRISHSVQVVVSTLDARRARDRVERRHARCGKRDALTGRHENARVLRHVEAVAHDERSAGAAVSRLCGLHHRTHDGDTRICGAGATGDDGR